MLMTLPTPAKRWPDMTRDERLAFVKTAPLSFVTARDAGVFIGASKNSILSVANRHGILFQLSRGHKVKQVEKARRPPRQPREKKARPATTFNAFVGAKSDPPPAAPKEKASREASAWARIDALPAWQPLEGAVSKPLWQLEAAECHWPTWRDGEPHTVCGAAAERGVYCEAHRRMSTGKI